MNKKNDYYVWIIILLAAAVRLWGINFGLPHTECRPDESIITDIVYSPLRLFHPGTFNYPSLYKYMLLCLYIFYFLGGIIIGKYHSAAGFFVEYEIDPTNFYLINRFLAVFLGIATVFVVYKIAKYIFDKKTAIISALFLSLTHLHVRDSHFGAVDIPATFFIMCSMWFVAKSIEDKKPNSYLMAGIYAGLATSTKYQGVLLVVPMLIVHCFNVLEGKNKKIRLFFDRKILLFIFSMAALFLVGTPYAILDTRRFIYDILYEFRHLEYGHGITLGIGWWYHLRFSLFYGLGWGLFLASLLGIITLIRINAKKAIVLYSFPFLYYFFLGRGSTVFLRYAIPLVPFLCIAASVFTVWTVSKLRPHLRSIVIYFLATAILLPSAYNVILSDRLLATKDNRLLVAEWIYKNIPQGSSIYQASLFPPGKVQLYPTLDSLPTVHYNPITKISYGIPESVRTIMGLWLKNKNIIGYEKWEYDEETKEFMYQKEIEKNLPRYIILEESPLLVYSVLQRDVQEILKKSYRLKETFIAINMEVEKNWFDQQDAFYLPFIGFEGIKRPGPNLYIYEINS